MLSLRLDPLGARVRSEGVEGHLDGGIEVDEERPQVCGSGALVMYIYAFGAFDWMRASVVAARPVLASRSGSSHTLHSSIPSSILAMN